MENVKFQWSKYQNVLSMKIKNYAMSVNLAIFYKEMSVMRILLINVLFQETNIFVECVKKVILMKMGNVLKIIKSSKTAEFQ